jgi:beta-mannanase
MICLSAGCDSQAPVYQSSRETTSGAVLKVPEKGAYIGAYIEFGDTEDRVTLEGIDAFEQMVGKHQAIIASSSYWGQGSFPLRNVELIARHGSVPLIFWSPWDKPYVEDRGPDRFSLTHILSGRWDGYIDTWADAARIYNRPLLVSWGLEMNGKWFPWSGYYYGAGNKAQNGRLAGPDTYKRAFRYVVDRVRKRGADRIQWVFHVNALPFPKQSWNSIAEYYPGSAYADWLGLSLYGMQFKGGSWTQFAQLMAAPYDTLSNLDAEKPLIVAEWGVGEFPAAGNKADWIRDAFSAMKTGYPRIKAAVYWHERWQNENETISNLKINSTPETLSAFQTAAADPHWLTAPRMYQPLK